MTLVVDASVAVKWLFPEIYTEAAKRVLKKTREIIAPDLIWAEVASTACKKIRQGQVAPEEALVLLREFQNYPIQTTESKALMETALLVAHEAGLSIYDALYLALSYDQDCSLVTADRRLYDRVHAAFPQSETLWIEDLET